MALQLRSDDEILQDIRNTLAWDVRIDDDQLSVEVKDGEVMLSGTVNTYSEKAVALEDVWKIKGVKNLTERIEVSPKTPRLDADIATDLYNVLKSDNRLDASTLTIKVAGSIVELSGTAASLTEKAAAEEDAWFTKGVVDVANYIEVSPTKARSDGEIVDDVRTAIVRDGRISDSTLIGVASSTGRVILSGTLQTPEERRAAEEDARFTAGVVDVRNEIALQRAA